MRRLLSTRYGFFGFAALVCWSTLFVIEKEHRWLAAALGALYAVLSLLFLLDEMGTASRAGPRVVVDEEGTAAELFAPPPPPGGGVS